MQRQKYSRLSQLPSDENSAIDSEQDLNDAVNLAIVGSHIRV